MNNYKNFSDDDLIFKEGRSNKWNDQLEIEEELYDRGYTLNDSGNWESVRQSAGSGGGAGGGLVGVFSGISPILIMLVIWAVVICVISMYAGGLFTQVMPDFISQEVKPYLSSNTGLDLYRVQAITLFMGMVFIYPTFVSSIVILYFLMFRIAPFSSLFKAQFLFFSLGSLYVAYIEWKADEVPLISLIIFILTFLLTFYYLLKLKKNWKAGIFILLTSTIAFWISGISFVSPYIALYVAAFSIIVLPGEFFKHSSKK